MNATFPVGITERARFIEGAVGFELGTIRDARRILNMTDDELQARQLDLHPLLRYSPERERKEAKARLRHGFKMSRVRAYAADIASEHR